jgi:hypothetical protein
MRNMILPRVRDVNLAGRRILGREGPDYHRSGLPCAVSGPAKTTQNDHQMAGMKNKAGIIGLCGSGPESPVQMCCDSNENKNEFNALFLD